MEKPDVVARKGAKLKTKGKSKYNPSLASANASSLALLPGVINMPHNLHHQIGYWRVIFLTKPMATNENASQALSLGDFTREKQKLAAWLHPVEGHSSDLMGAHGASNEFKVLLWNVKSQKNELRLNTEDTI